MVERVSSGVDDLDAALGGGLMAGDNVVWFGDDDGVHHSLQEAFLRAAPAEGTKVFVTTREAPTLVRARVGAETEILDARPGQAFAEPMLLERTVLERSDSRGSVVVDDLDDLVRRLRPERALLLFTRICPQLFDAGTICYWRAGDGSRSVRDAVRGVTQCVLDVSGGRLRVDKAEGRPGAQGRIYRLGLDKGEVRIDQERARGRLAEGLRKLRSTRRLSQSDVARVAGVSPSAISQAESGYRGLGLDTVIAIAEGYGVGLDDLLGSAANPGYVIARRDRTAPRQGVTALLDDPGAGLRAFFVDLGPGERGAPPAPHKGTEVIVVGSGLVQIDLGVETPVMRAGDAVLVTTTAVQGWQNLLAAPSRFFWVLRDPLPREA